MFWKIVFFIPGAAIGFILSTAIGQMDETAGLVIMALGIAIGGSITAKLGTMLFLKAEIEAQQSGSAIKAFIRFLVIAIVVVAAILLIGKSSIF